MSLGMVRKIDELGRVVLPKEMRRVLNIKTGSSVEMEINEEGKIVLKKFSELENVLFMAKCLGEVLFERLDLKGFVCDEDKVLSVFGLNKKDYLNKKVLFGEIKKEGCKVCEVIESECEEKVKTFPIKFQGFEKGFVGVFGLEKESEYIKLLIEFFSKLVED